MRRTPTTLCRRRVVEIFVNEALIVSPSDGAADRGGQLGPLSGERTYAEALSSRDLQHQLASGMAGHSAVKCLSGLRQRDCFRDHRADCAGIYQRSDSDKLFSIGVGGAKQDRKSVVLGGERN